MIKKDISRREFLRAVAIGAAGLGVRRAVWRERARLLGPTLC